MLTHRSRRSLGNAGRSARAAGAFAVALASAGFARGGDLSVTDQPAAGSVRISAGDGVADIFVDPNDSPLSRKAAELLADDVRRVTGRRPRVVHDAAAATGQMIWVGTLGSSPAIDRLAADGKIDVSAVRGKWETFAVQTVERPLPGVERAVVVVGSDRRGTAYGAFDLSDAIGVSPWYWWADVTPTHRDAIYLSPGADRQGPPSVRYRGVFINDEDWGLQPWATKTFEPEFGNIGPKTYEKVFELLLRLRGNYLWPAMHPGTTEFGTVPENVRLADEWGIVVGASHTEAMNRNNVDWPKLNRGPWRYDTNRQPMLDYWAEWAKLRGPYEAVWTVGLRGVHDAAMLGPKDTPSRVKILEHAIRDQRALLAQYVSKDVTAVPQAFTPYKEALDLYRAGLKVPDDVTLVWPDDNFGYIRELSTPREQERSGGAGVYYHLSYLGRPFSHVWLDTTPAALIWEEMSKAYAQGARRLWVVNVGDVKPAEPGIDFWMKLAWDVPAWHEDAQPAFLHDWAARTFGPPHADEIAAVMDDYYRLNFQRKPEALKPEAFSLTAYDEAGRRLADFRRLVARAERIGRSLPADRQDAYFELVLYPVRATADSNVAFIEDARNAATAGPESDSHAAAAAAAVARIERDTDHYNHALAGGKWAGIMTARGTTSKTWGNPWPRSATRPTAGAAAVRGDAAPPADAPDAADDARADAGTGPRRFAERDGYVSIDAGHFARSAPAGGAAWRVVPGLGRTGRAVTVEPTTAASIDDLSRLAKDAPALEYDFSVDRGGAAKLTTYALPTYPLNPERKLRFAVAIDDAPPQVIDLTDAGAGKRWAENVTTNTVATTTSHSLAAAGRHTLHVWSVDPGVVLDKLVLDLGGVQQSTLGPPETVER